MTQVIELVVNGEAQSLGSGTTVDTLVRLLGCGTRGVAVAVNDEVVPRSTWDAHTLTNGDRVEVLRAVQGG
jgi:sulfur carrier protein